MDKVDVKYVPEPGCTSPPTAPPPPYLSYPMSKSFYRQSKVFKSPALFVAILALVASVGIFLAFVFWLQVGTDGGDRSRIRDQQEQMREITKELDKLADLVNEHHREIQKFMSDTTGKSKAKEKSASTISGDEPVCSLKKDSGLCKGAMPRWYFDQSKDMCLQFTYGGCGGNANNFVTLTECLEECQGSASSDDPCVLTPDHGPCDGDLTRFYFNKVKERCIEFSYGGCAGNANNFVTAEECTSTCSLNGVNRNLEDGGDGDEAAVDRCHLRPEQGRCRAHMTRWYFDAETGTCNTFIWGGCVGNNNNFASAEECKDACLGVEIRRQEQPTDEKDVDVCQLPAVTGPCRALHLRFFFNSDTSQCEKFVYGGCDGNRNNFETVEACENTCLV